MRSAGVHWVRRTVAACGILLGAGAPVGAESPVADAPAELPVIEAPVTEGLVAVLLFSNYTGVSVAIDEVMPRVHQELQSRAIPHISSADLRPVQRKHRIRSVGGITAKHAGLIRVETGAELLLLGSCDVFLADGNPEVGVSARIVDIETMRIVAAQSVSATGADYAGLFNTGRVTDIQDLAGRVVAELFEDLELDVQRTEREVSREPLLPRVAIVPLDNLSKMPWAGEIATNILLSELVTRGFDVVEPGRVRGLFLSNRRVLRGGVDRPMIGKMSDEFGMAFVVTGEVEVFRPARGDSETAVPIFAFGARQIAPDGRLTMTFDDDRDGADSERVFNLGRCRSLGRLVRRSVQEFATRIAAPPVGASL